MLLLYLKHMPPTRNIVQIYIPLCFYFISTEMEMREKLLYLHSTMLLLYLREQVEAFTVRFIYIPLCFYFIFSAT